MYLRLSPYREILQSVLTDLDVNEGIIKIIGSASAGKTALLSQLFKDLEARDQRAVFFLKPPVTVDELQNNILQSLALSPHGNFTKNLTAYLMQHCSKQPLVLIFDDAQLIDTKTFYAIRLICNIQDASRALIRVIVCGTEALDGMLSAPSLRAITQYLSQSLTLPYMTRDEVADFCHAYWTQLGIEMKVLPEKALQKLHAETQGKPGLLQARLVQGTTGGKLLEHARNDGAPRVRRPGKWSGPQQTWWPGVLALLGLLVLGGGGIYLYYRMPQLDATAEREANVAVARDSVTSVTAQQTAVPAPQPELPTVAPAPEPSQPEAPPPVATAATNVNEATPSDKPQVEEPAVAAAELAPQEPVAAVTEPPQQEPAAAVTESPPQERVATAAEPPPQETVVAVAESRPTPGEFIARWTASWQSRDVDSYLAQYAEDFTPPGDAALADWQAQRRRVIGNASSIEISVDPIESVNDAGDGAQYVRFWLHYRSSNYADRTLKELLLVPYGSDWRIRAENNLRTERGE